MQDEHIDKREYLKYRQNRKDDDAYFPEGTVHEDEFFSIGVKHFFWDKAKNEANKAAHGIDFYTAAYVFNDEYKIFNDNVFDGDRQRMDVVGEPQPPMNPDHPIDTTHSKPKAVIGKVEGVILVVFIDYTPENQDDWNTSLEDDFDDETKEKEILILSARPAYPKEADAYLDGIFEEYKEI